ncbi:MAG: hypothetical protein J5772_02495 [Clostridia bacterium]|nr:hypothetical protein [Clostridia bacterium]
MSKEGKRSSSAIKKTLIVFGAAVAIFAIINVLWYFGYRLQYNKIAARLDASEYAEDAEAKTRTVYSKVVDEYIIRMTFPSYLQKGGKITIAKNTDYSSDGLAQSNDEQYSIAFYYWPKPFGKERLGVSISENDSVENNWYQVYIYPDLSLVIREDYRKEEIQLCNELINKYKDEIERMKAILEDTIGVDFDKKAWYGKV